MDPNKSLEEQRRWIEMLREMVLAGPMSKPEVEAFIDRALELCDRAEALDGWMTKGGFLPAEWTKKR